MPQVQSVSFQITDAPRNGLEKALCLGFVICPLEDRVGTLQFPAATRMNLLSPPRPGVVWKETLFISLDGPRISRGRFRSIL